MNHDDHVKNHVFPTRLMLLFFQETPVTAAKFLWNAGNRRYFCRKYRRFRVFSRRSAIIGEKFQPKFRPRTFVKLIIIRRDKGVIVWLSCVFLPTLHVF